MPTIQENNKRIAKNTLFLYLRMFLVLIVGLITSRVVLRALGFVDYGIYNVVGGVVLMLNFLNVGMSTASQRFISFALGRTNKTELEKTFCTSIFTHLSIALILFVVMECIGVWFVNAKLNIPHDRMVAANWVFQFSIVTSIVSIISVPYNATIIAHERMDAFAYISIFEVIAKLLIAYGITISPFDRLIVYGFLLMLVQIIVRIIYSVYCQRHFEECHFRFQFDKELFKKMFSFAGWTCIGNMGFSCKDQLSNILLNLFFGTTVNAARGIAAHVSSIVNGFASNFTMAMNPQIIKLYAVENMSRYKDLAYAGSKYAFFLLSLISIPFIINRDYILHLWLGQVPEYTGIFVAIILLATTIYSMSHTISTAILATGKIRTFQISLSILLLTEIPIAYIILKLGGKPYQALYPMLVTNFLSLLLRILILRRMNSEFSVWNYLKNTILRCLVIYVIAFGISYYVNSFFDENLLCVILSTLISVVVVFLTVFTLGLNKVERSFVVGKIRKMIVKR